MSLPVAILAGGLATRLHPLTELIPKSLLDIAGKPFAVHQIELLRRQGISDIVFCVGHLGEMVQSTLGDGSLWRVNLRFVFDGPTLLGTGGALRRALPMLGPCFFVLYGDSYLECDFRAVESAFQNSGKLGLMTVYRNEDRWDRSNVWFRDGNIVVYDKRAKRPEMQHIDYGLGALHSSVLEAYPADKPFDLSAVYQNLIARSELAGYEAPGRFYEVGSPTGLEETSSYLERKGISK